MTRSLGDKALAGITGMTANMLLTRLIGLASISVLGRMLSPEDFGLIAIAMSFVGLLEILQGRQLEQALLRETDPDKTRYDTVFALGLLIGLAGAGVLLVAAGPLARLFDLPDLRAALMWLALVPLLQGLRNPWFTLHERAMRFGPMIRRNLAGRALLAIVSVAGAVVWADHRALVWGTVAMYLVFAVGTWGGGLPRPGLSLRHWRLFAGFAGWMTGSLMAGHLLRQVPALILGQVGAVAHAGHYRMGSELGVMLIRQMAMPVANALYPALNSVAGDLARLRAAFVLTLGGLWLVILPIGVGLALAAPEAVRLMLGPQWQPIVPLVQILAPATALAAAGTGVDILVMSRGTPRVLFLRNLLFLMGSLPLLGLAHAVAGMTGLALGVAGLSLGQMAVNLSVAGRIVGLPMAGIARVALRPVLATGAMAAALAGATGLADGPDPFALGPGAAAGLLATKALIGGAIYAGALLGLWQMAGRPPGPEARLMARLTKRSG